MDTDEGIKVLKLMKLHLGAGNENKMACRKIQALTEERENTLKLCQWCSNMSLKGPISTRLNETSLFIKTPSRCTSLCCVCVKRNQQGTGCVRNCETKTAFCTFAK